MMAKGDRDALVRLLRETADGAPLAHTLSRFPRIDRATLGGILRAVAGELAEPPTHDEPRVDPNPASRRGAKPAGRGGAPEAILRTDGASRGNPGPSSAAVVIESPSGIVLDRAGVPLGRATNNQAEYRALILALTRALALGLSRVEVLSDSELMVRQMNGEYKVKNADIAALKRDAGELEARFASVRYRHVPRGENAAADKLANDILDGRASASR